MHVDIIGRTKNFRQKFLCATLVSVMWTCDSNGVLEESKGGESDVRGKERMGVRWFVARSQSHCIASIHTRTAIGGICDYRKIKTKARYAHVTIEITIVL